MVRMTARHEALRPDARPRGTSGAMMPTSEAVIPPSLKPQRSGCSRRSARISASTSAAKSG
jgi:hypothetical protein